jgi:hypothetical protein
MYGFENPNVEPESKSKSEEAKVEDIPEISTLSWDEIERCVARGRQLRSAHFAEWGRRLARTWGSVFRGPGRILPPNVNAGRYAR